MLNAEFFWKGKEVIHVEMLTLDASVAGSTGWIVHLSENWIDRKPECMVRSAEETSSDTISCVVFLS